MHQRFKALTLYLHSLGKVNLNCDLINKNTIFSFNHVEFLINDLFFKGFLAGKVSEGAGLSGTLINIRWTVMWNILVEILITAFSLMFPHTS